MNSKQDMRPELPMTQRDDGVNSEAKSISRASDEAADHECICVGNWRLLVKEYEPLFGRWFRDVRDGSYWRLFGIVHGKDDYYYGVESADGEHRLLSCVGGLSPDSWGVELVDQPQLPSLLSRDPDVMHGEVCIAGTRITAAAIKRYNDAGYAPDEIIAEYPDLTREQIAAAIAFDPYAPPQARDSAPGISRESRNGRWRR